MIRNRYILSVFSICVLGCSESDHGFKSYYNQIKQSCRPEVLEEIKNDSTENLYKYVPEIKSEFLVTLTNHEDLVNYLDSQNIESDIDKMFILLNGVYDKLNEKEIRFQIYIDSIKSFRTEISEWKERNMLCEMSRINNSEKNYKNLKFNDKIRFSLPYVNNENKRSDIYFYGCPDHYSPEDMLLTVEATLIQKYEENENKYFELLVQRINLSSIYFQSRKIEVGSSIALNLYQYGLEVKKL